MRMSRANHEQQCQCAQDRLSFILRFDIANFGHTFPGSCRFVRRFVRDTDGYIQRQCFSLHLSRCDRSNACKDLEASWSARVV